MASVCRQSHRFDSRPARALHHCAPQMLLVPEVLHNVWMKKSKATQLFAQTIPFYSDLLETDFDGHSGRRGYSHQSEAGIQAVAVATRLYHVSRTEKLGAPAHR
jgi:hypothetical protein